MQNELMGLMAKISVANPNFRLCQIISNATKLGGWNSNDIFYCTDEILLNGLQKSYKNNIKTKESRIMKVQIYSRKAIEELLQSDFPENTAVISFYDPPNIRTGEVYSSVDFGRKAERVFKIPIHDIDIEVLPDYNLSFDTYFPEVNELAAYIKKAYNDGLDIICQCEYGQSRSSACAAAILEHYYHNGISVFADYRYYPNQLVYNKIKDALDKE